jgi:hypothetical protein
MSLKAALHQYLAAQSAVTSLVPAARIFRGRRNAGSALPAITYFRVSENEESHQGAASGLSQARVQFDIWAATDSGAEAIFAALRCELHGMTNASIGNGGDAVTVQRIELENTTDAAEWPEDGSDSHVYHISTDAVIWYETTVPTFS